MTNITTNPSIDTGNPGLNSLVWRAIIGGSGVLTGVIMGWLNGRGFATTDITILGQTISPAVLVGGAVLSTLVTGFGLFWGWFKGTQLGKKIEGIKIAGVTAGMNMTIAGSALAVATPGGALVPQPVTAASANDIIKNFSTTTPVLGQATPGNANEVAITDALNAAQIGGKVS